MVFEDKMETPISSIQVLDNCMIATTEKIIIVYQLDSKNKWTKCNIGQMNEKITHSSILNPNLFVSATASSSFVTAKIWDMNTCEGVHDLIAFDSVNFLFFSFLFFLLLLQKKKNC